MDKAARRAMFWVSSDGSGQRTVNHAVMEPMSSPNDPEPHALASAHAQPLASALNSLFNRRWRIISASASGTPHEDVLVVESLSRV